MMTVNTTIHPGITVPADPHRDIENRYNELLYSVVRVFPGETRHQTALRYIREREAKAIGCLYL